MSDDLKSKLLAKRNNTDSGMPEDTVTIDGIGQVRVRGLSRGEVFMMRKAQADGGIKDLGAWERRMLHLALLDPAMTEDEVGEWQRVSLAGELEHVSDKVSELSGMSEGADKSGLQDVRDES